MSWVNQAKTPTRSGIEPDSGVLVRYLRGPGPVNNLSKPGLSLTNRPKKRFFLGSPSKVHLMPDRKSVV